MITLILTILLYPVIAIAVLYAVRYLLALLPIDPVLQNVILFIVGVLLLVWALQHFGVHP